MQKLFDDQVVSAQRDRSLLMGQQEWQSHSSAVDIHNPPEEQSLDEVRLNQRRMLGGIIICTRMNT